MRSVFYWEAAGLSLDRANPYGGLLAQGMAGLGAELIAGHVEELSEDWLRQNRDQVDVLHLNWPHYMYAAPDLADRVSRCADMISHLALARSLGYKVVWTVHNLYPHESSFHDLDRLARMAITSLASAVIVHCQHARALVQEHFSRHDGVFVIPHGHFIDIYPNTLTRAEVRSQLGLSESSFVYLAFGNVSPYKGMERLLEIFSGLPGKNLILLLAAKVYNEYGDELAEQAAQIDSRIVVHTSRFFPNEELQLYHNAADVAVLPFLDVLTSGTVITALSFGLPVIVPAIGCLPELVDDSMGIVYDPNQPGALGKAMTAFQQRDLTASGMAAYRRAESLSWDSIARLTLDAYRF